MADPRHPLPGGPTPAWRGADESAAPSGVPARPARGDLEQPWRLAELGPRRRAGGASPSPAGRAGGHQGPARPWPTRCAAGEPAGEGDCPWVPPGAARRDCEPHRGPLLLALGDASLLLGALSLCLGFLVAPPAVALGASAWVLASRDLRHMRAGVTDPGGLAPTALGRCRARAGVALGLYGAVLWGWLLALIA